MEQSAVNQVPKTIGEYCWAMYRDRLESELSGIIAYYEGIERLYRENPGGPIFLRLPLPAKTIRRYEVGCGHVERFDNHFVLAYCPENSGELGMEFGKLFICGFRLLGDRYETFVNRIPGRREGTLVEDTEEWKDASLFSTEAIGGRMIGVFHFKLSKLLREDVLSGTFLKPAQERHDDLVRGISFGREAVGLLERLGGPGSESVLRKRLFGWIPPAELVAWQEELIARYATFSGTREQWLKFYREGDANGRASNPLLRFPGVKEVLEAADAADRD